MTCFDPKLCYTSEKGKRLFRHYSQSSYQFKALAQQRYDCGTCPFCRKKKAKELAARCVLQASLYKQSSFITLTYDETKEGYQNELCYDHIQKFKKKLRSYLARRRIGRVSIFNVHEYGMAGKKHWHLILFGYDFPDKTIHSFKKRVPLYTSDQLEKIWGHGFVSLGDVSEASAMYQCLYMEKDLYIGNQTNGKRSKSTHSGIGREYFLRHYRQILRLGYIPFSGRKLPLPRYFFKIAHKHYSHFYEPANFFDQLHPRRKKLYTPFKPGSENKEIADLFIYYRDTKQPLIDQLKKEWDEAIINHLRTKQEFDFIKSGENYEYDLKNKQHTSNF